MAEVAEKVFMAAWSSDQEVSYSLLCPPVSILCSVILKVRWRLEPGARRCRIQLASIPFLVFERVRGAVAQLGERLICIQEAVGSIPISSTSSGPQSVGVSVTD